MMGAHVAQYPNTVARVWKEGHTIITHTWSHPHLMSLSDDQIIAEIRQTENAIANITGGFRPKYIRPPYGEADDRVKAIFTAHNLRPVLWNMDTTDYETMQTGSPITQITDTFKKALTTNTGLNPFKDPGFISLQHDLFLQSIQQEPDIINLLKSNNFRFMTVDECVGDPWPYKNTQDQPATREITLVPNNSTATNKTLRANDAARGGANGVLGVVLTAVALAMV